FAAGSAPVWQSQSTSSQNWEITEGSVYIGVRFGPTTPNHYIATDESTTTTSAGGYWTNDSTTDWTPIQSDFPNYKSLFVRSEINSDGGTPAEGCLEAENEQCPSAAYTPACMGTAESITNGYIG